MPILPINVGRTSSRVKGLKIEKNKMAAKIYTKPALNSINIDFRHIITIINGQEVICKDSKNVVIFDLEIIFKVKTIKITPVIQFTQYFAPKMCIEICNNPSSSITLLKYNTKHYITLGSNQILLNLILTLDIVLIKKGLQCYQCCYVKE